MPEPRGAAEARPFLKWAGGKSRSASALVRLAPSYEGRYWEPFMGSAAVFFALAPEAAVLSDANEDLVTCFNEVARDPFALMDRLDKMPNSRRFYMRTRKANPRKMTAVDRAARVIYLNKTSFRGLWRVNRQGEFNVPYGAYTRPYYNRDNLIRASKALAESDIRCCDYSMAFQDARPGDWIYLDPPYVPDRPWGDFKRYTPDQFHDEDHQRLAELMTEATDRGIFVMLTNSATDTVRKLFRDWNILELATRRDIHLKSSERVSQDLVITNYEPARQPELLSELR